MNIIRIKDVYNEIILQKDTEAEALRDQLVVLSNKNNELELQIEKQKKFIYQKEKDIERITLLCSSNGHSML